MHSVWCLFRMGWLPSWDLLPVCGRSFRPLVPGWSYARSDEIIAAKIGLLIRLGLVPVRRGVGATDGDESGRGLRIQEGMAVIGCTIAIVGSRAHARFPTTIPHFRKVWL